MKKFSFGQILDFIFFVVCLLGCGFFVFLDYVEPSVFCFWLPILIKLFDISESLESICKSSGKKSVDNK